MVEVSSLRDLDIYTVHGKYVGKVEDVVLNIQFPLVSYGMVLHYIAFLLDGLSLMPCDLDL